jgi:tryptophanyl-tRNA synthetase
VENASDGSVLTGRRPTGDLHLGHLAGMLRQLAGFQGARPVYVLVADVHALTTLYEEPERLKRTTLGLVKDLLGGGLDPEQTSFVLQSSVPEHFELATYLSMLVTVARLERNPTYKELRAELGERRTASLGFLSYPVLQAADILPYDVRYVPVGQDQLPHLELTREVARSFNRMYGETFRVPEPALSRASKLLGTDARPMHTSYGNTIRLAAASAEIGERVSGSITDPQKVRQGDPGRPEICPVYGLHDFANPREAPQVATDCRAGMLGCVECKRRAANALTATLEPFREARASTSDATALEILAAGTARARERATPTLERVRDRMMVGYLR